MMRELPINPPEPREVAECAWCGREIYEGDEAAWSKIHDAFVHGGECKREFAYTSVYEESGIIDVDLTIG